MVGYLSNLPENSMTSTKSREFFEDFEEESSREEYVPIHDAAIARALHSLILYLLLSSLFLFHSGLALPRRATGYQ